jgi:hypothetical protein
VRALLLFVLVLCGCARSITSPRRIAIIFEDSSAPLEWRADMEAAPREIHGESCRNAIGLPLFFRLRPLGRGDDLVGWGEAGYRDAVAQAQAQAPGSTLSDIRADIRFINILVFRKECVHVTASAR